MHNKTDLYQALETFQQTLAVRYPGIEIRLNMDRDITRDRSTVAALIRFRVERSVENDVLYSNTLPQLALANAFEGMTAKLIEAIEEWIANSKVLP